MSWQTVCVFTSPISSLLYRSASSGCQTLSAFVDYLGLDIRSCLCLCRRRFHQPLGCVNLLYLSSQRSGTLCLSCKGVLVNLQRLHPIIMAGKAPHQSQRTVLFNLKPTYQPRELSIASALLASQSHETSKDFGPTVKRCQEVLPLLARARDILHP